MGGFVRPDYRLLTAGLALALTPVVAEAANRPARSHVLVIRPLSVVKAADLEFGGMISSPVGGTVIIDPTSGNRTITGGVTAAGGGPRPAQFFGYGFAGQSVQVNRGPLPVLTRVGGGASMNVTQLTLNGPTLRVLSSTGVLDLKVGGTLVVGANQAEGQYQGNFTIIVTYF